ncbi:MAG TPA: NAD-dependent epimerase/dehydratase family protein [Candidatus Thalassarchaeaceae archaeon]|nr:NAD-dependent epimerase/dehydratase family protein [Candidatus Thalassarchaeaceae archaeon]HJL58918.1 NAD-dependent epimerase/dehydratase family protein [Candidatus Thalassarchaeaceae archaeon]HJM20048.1 NAD-dependent epimerase/dehydratase family protein [Candidatus Thalassarchaeaceae archaeon]
MHCLVTGGAGFVGSHLVDLLLDAGHDVSIFDNFSSGRREFLQHHGEDVTVIEGDLLDLGAVNQAMQGIEIVYHLAANPDIRLGTTITDTDLKQGTVATYNVLEAMRLNGVKKIAFSSSSVVYGEAEQMPTPEDYGPLFPISLYGASKLGSEALITSWVGTFELQAWIFRFANIVGARGTHGVIFDFIHKLRVDPNRLEVLGNGRQEKSYMEVRDCAAAMIHLVSSTNETINCYNLGSDDTCSVSRIAEIVIEESGLPNVSIDYTGGDRGWAGDVPKAMLDPTRMNNAGYATKYNSEGAVRHTAQTLMEEIGIDNE